MPGAHVHAAALERMMEQLCRIRVGRLDDVIKRRGDKFAIDPKAPLPPHAGGVYAYWWVGDHVELRRANRSFEFHGPAGRPVAVELDEEWMGLSAGLPVPLYVGKTVGSIRKRMGQHLKLGDVRKIIAPGKRKTRAPTTSCQVRAGIERLFPEDQDPVRIIRECLGLSFVVLDHDEHAANRFYLENLAIGRMRPVLNLDVVR